MNRQQLKRINKAFINQVPYALTYWEDFDYTILSHIMFRLPGGKREDKKSTNEIIIMLDTETSKTKKNAFEKGKIVPVDNMIVCWSIALRAFDKNIVTLYGRKPSDIPKCLHDIHFNMHGDKTFIFVHNLAYDWVFMRKFLMSEFGEPAGQLNTKPHYPLTITFGNGIILRDSLILAQRSLARWGSDLKVPDAKAIGYWDYDKLRDQHSYLDLLELLYIQNDVLCGVECIDATMHQLNKNINSLPYTATGIPREQVRKRGKLNNAHVKFLRQVPDYETHKKLEMCYHGGFTHGNRHFINMTMHDVQGWDFASSYPYCMLSEKFPTQRFKPYKKPLKPERVAALAEKYAFIVKFTAVNIRIRDDFMPMPALQFSKCLRAVNPLLDNGRVLSAGLVQIYLTETDLKVINEVYTWEDAICTDIEVSIKTYLPKWFCDYVYECFVAKTQLKGGDPVAYALSKTVINALYGMLVQKPVKEVIEEDYQTGLYDIKEDFDECAEYEKYKEKINSILPYQWGVWVTSYAFYNLFELGKCADSTMEDNGGLWLYSDTDSCYGIKWNTEKIDAYNKKCIEKLEKRGYGGVPHNGRLFYMGVAETEGDKDIYTEFRYQGAKRYAGRQKQDGELHITVAGVPKKTGAKCLNNDLETFAPGLVFPGTVTGKSTHYFMFKDQIEIVDGNELGDSLDLCPCDYLLSSVNCPTWEEINSEVLFNYEIDKVL